MKIFELDPGNPDHELINEIASLLKEGAIIAYPTDTLYGLGADALNPEAVRRIGILKGRDSAKPFPYIIDKAERMNQWDITLSVAAGSIAEELWPGPVSLVVEGSAYLPGHVLDSRKTICLRVPENAIARSIAGALGGLLVATSANPAGRPAARSAHEATAYFRGEIDAVVDGGPSLTPSPSTVVDVSGQKVVILREGAVPGERILRVIADSSKGPRSERKLRKGPK